ncbi:DUF6011 domain-containing protein [Crocinitomicaceae bacterium]|nr:DUF6011 domain-containing protein [Crocinitomicaceae bacterium]
MRMMHISRELKIDLDTIVDQLIKHNLSVEKNPNLKLTQQQLDCIKSEYGVTDAMKREAFERFSLGDYPKEKFNKRPNKSNDSGKYLKDIENKVSDKSNDSLNIFGEKGICKIYFYINDKKVKNINFDFKEGEGIIDILKRYENLLVEHRFYNSKMKFLYRNSINHFIAFNGTELLLDTREKRFSKFWPELKLNYFKFSNEIYELKKRYESELSEHKKNNPDDIFGSFEFKYKFEIETDNAFLRELVTDSSRDLNRIPDYERYIEALRQIVDFSNNPLLINEDKAITSLIEKQSVKSTNQLTLRQKALLLQGMMESNARKLAEAYFTEGKLNESQLNAVDEIIEKAIQKYDTELVSTLLELPDKPFHIKDAKRILYKPKKANSNDNSIELIGVDGSIFKFYFKKTNSSISIKSNDELAATISNDGEVRFETSDKKKRMVTANMILSYVNDPIGSIVYFGAQTGSCSFCNKPLTDPRSKIHGYGSQCAKLNDLPWG